MYAHKVTYVAYICMLFSGFRHAADPGRGEKRFESESTGKVCLVGGGAANLPSLQQQHVVRGVSGGLTCIYMYFVLMY